jgi:hypothetical protein
VEGAREIGIDEYNEEQQRKIRILHSLLDDYNDGKRKSFYCMAINLLPLKEIERILDELIADSQLSATSFREKVDFIVSRFRSLAKDQGVELKLRKKTKE